MSTTTINAATIYAAVTAAALAAPDYDVWSAAGYEFQAITQRGRAFFADRGIAPGAGAIVEWLTEQENDLVYAEFYAAQDLPARHITFKTGARSSHKIQNTRERLEKFAAIVKTGAKLFGGGMVRTVKARAAVVWPAQAVKLVYELLQDKQHEDAAELAQDKCGAVFYEGFNNYKKTPEAFMLFAPQAVAGLGDEFKSARCTDGRYCVYGVASGLTISSQFKTRQGAEDQAVKVWSEASEDKRATAMAKAKTSDQAAARLQWLAQNDIVTDETIAERIEAEQAQQAQDAAAEQDAKAARLARQAAKAAEAERLAAQDVAQVLASAQAAAAIEQASESAALQDLAVAAPMASNPERRALRADVVLLSGAIVKHSFMDNGAQHAELASGRAMTGAEWFDYCAQIHQETAEPIEADAAPELATVEAQACEAVASCALAGAQAGGGSAGHASTKLAHAAASVSTGQQINSKIGNWSARFYTAPDGRAMLAFSESSGAGGAWPFDSGRDRMAALQTMARNADQAAAAATPAKRAPRPFTEQSTEYTLRGITWRVTVARYWAIDEVTESQEPDLLCWRASKQGGRFGGTEFMRIDAEKMPRDSVARAHAFFQMVEAQDKASATSSATAGVCATAPNAGPQNPAPVSSGQFKTIWQGVSGSAPDVAGQNPAGASSGQFKSKNGDDLTPAATPPAASGTGALSITITRAEGLTSECGQPVTVGSFAAADALLHGWSESAPKSGAYDKCDFLITWPDGGSYDGRYDLKHHSCEAASLSAHMIDEAEYHTGKFCPLHLSAAAYKMRMDETSAETRAAYTEVLATMASLGAYFSKVRPVAIDLRAMVAAGAAPGALVGLGVVYCGDRCNQGGRGAIVATGNSDYYGLVVDVVLEDGSEHRATRAADFGDGIGARYRLDGKMHGAPYLAQLAGAVATVKASASAARAQAQDTHAKALIDVAAQYGQLKQATEGGKLRGVTLAAANARILLRQQFPGVKFSVTCEKYSMGNSLTAAWTDGPTTTQVDTITDKFSGGSFNGMEDVYEYSSSAFTELFGSAKYTHTRRELSDTAIVALLAQEWPNEAGRPTLADYHSGNRNTYDEHGRSRVYMASVHWSASEDKASA